MASTESWHGVMESWMASTESWHGVMDGMGRVSHDNGRSHDMRANS